MKRAASLPTSARRSRSVTNCASRLPIATFSPPFHSVTNWTIGTSSDSGGSPIAASPARTRAT